MAAEPILDNADEAKKDLESRDVQDELELFLSSTDGLGSRPNKRGGTTDTDDEDETYESDGGTRYVKDHRTGKWVHEALAPPPKKKQRSTGANDDDDNHKAARTANGNQQHPPPPRKKRKKPKFAARNARNWIYVTGLPKDATVDEVAAFFGKAGILDLDPETQKPKVKLYRTTKGGAGRGDHDDDAEGECKGDASICYARPESVELALTLLDGAPFRLPSAGITPKNADESNVLHVERAKFEERQDQGDQKQQKQKLVSSAKRRVAKLAARQAMDWDDGEFNGRLTGGLKGLRIIVLKHIFRPDDLKRKGGNSTGDDEEEQLLGELELRVRTECEKFGDVEKMTLFSRHPDGVVVVKYAQPGAASDAVQGLNGRPWERPANAEAKSTAPTSTTLEAMFWDGVTDYTVRDEVKEEKEMEERHEEFGAWLEQQELPEELRLQTQES